MAFKPFRPGMSWAEWLAEHTADIALAGDRFAGTTCVRTVLVTIIDEDGHAHSSLRVRTAEDPGEAMRMALLERVTDLVTRTCRKTVDVPTVCWFGKRGAA